jgi:periplasmic protein CpxP/Spy
MEINMTARSRLPSLALVALLALPGAAFAQATSPAATPPTPTPHAATPAGQNTPRRLAPQAVEQHIDRLHAQLRITAAQQQQWDQFAQVMRDNAANMRQAIEQRGTQLASMNAAQDMQSYAQLAQQHAQDMQKLSATFQTLYDSMSPEQKQNADAVFRGRATHAAHRRSASSG